MKHYLVFFKKELLEYNRTYKLLILLLVFLILGIMNPLTAKLTPDLLAKFMPEGVSITLPEPSSLDSWAQFYKNVTQMGLIVTILVFSGVLSSELSKGTLIILLTKGLPRRVVILAKYMSMLVLWSASILTSFLVTWAYTVYIFPDGKSANLLFSMFCLWLYGALLLAVLLLAATLVKSSYGSLLITGVVVVLLTILNIAPAIQQYNPLSLAAKNMDLVMQNIEPSSLFPAIGVTVLATVVLLFAAVVIFRKKQL
ncbi:MAG TPA: ABC transporter permease subunit [Firmicutes bacterium]|nr:ABC transporter permease subunit [Bacillota bacterium]